MGFVGKDTEPNDAPQHVPGQPPKSADVPSTTDPSWMLSANAFDESLQEPASITAAFVDDLPFALRESGTLPDRWKRRQRLCVYLFFATCLSTFLIGSNLFPTMLFQSGRKYIMATGLWNMAWEGLKYSGPLMLILLCHEMGHYLQARRYGVPATFPFFIPMPIPPLGTMGAVIVQGAGVANRRAMFDIAVSGPLAGLVVALPVLYYGVTQSSYVEYDFSRGGIEFGEPLLLQWMIQAVHGPQPDGMVLVNSSLLFAGWVGVLITALNLIPVGQLDGGHILYTLIRKKAHFVAYAVLIGGFAYMVYIQYPAYLLLFILMLLMGPKHPPTSNDSMRLGWPRQVIGWLTMSFIILGFTLRPIVVHEPTPNKEPDAKPAVQMEDIPVNA
jgi:Zn-dependent protease